VSLTPAAGAEPGRLRSFGAGLALVGVLALAVRLIYILALARVPVGVGGDASFYNSSANLLVHGHFYYREIVGHAYPTAEHPPLFSLVLGLGSLFGGDTLLAHRVISCVIGSCGVAAIALLGRRVGGSRVGLLAGAIAAVYPPLVTADGLVMSEPLFVLLVAVAMLLALRLIDRRSTRGAALLGAVIALAALTRGEGLVLLPLLVWPAALRTGPGRARRLLATTAAAALVLAPWVVRNVVVFHRVMLAADSNTLIAGANCPDTYYGHDIGWWSLDCMARARSPAQLHNGDAATGAAFRYAGDHLGRLPLVAAVRVLRTFDFFQPLRQGNRELRRRWIDVAGLVFYYPLLLLAAVGLVSLRERRWVLLAPVWMTMLVSALGWGIGRFRVAADISLLVLAALALARAGATAGFSRRSSGRRRRPPGPAPAG
jgi:4-amino-4-deoxy-L-arabinose transferase-like glycosyltransferase